MWNPGVLTSEATPEAQEQYTPYYAVDPILKYIPKDKTVWLPFDEEFSAYYQKFLGGGGKLCALT